MKRIHSNDLKNIETFDETNWTSKSFVLNISTFMLSASDAPEKFDSGNVVFCDKIPKPSQYLISPDKYKNLISVKNQIDDVKKEKRSAWNRWVHLLNPYEKIGSFSSIDSGTITSRAFYKLYELLVFYELNFVSERSSATVSLHLCEAPGGFISAMKYIYKNVDWYAHTLYSGADSLKIDPSLRDSRRWIASDTDGDLYKLENIIALRNELPSKADIITGDGGFDVSYDANSQEQLSFKLIYAQFLTAMHTQKENGVFILKIFDTFTRPTYQLLYLFCKYYKTVEIIKPRTSRSSNSEKYIVAIGFRGIQQEELSELEKVLTMWGNDKHRYCKNLGFPIDAFRPKRTGVAEPRDSLLAIALRNYNDFLAVNQSWYIHKSLCCLKYLNKQQASAAHPNNLEALQNKRALEFCIAFGLRAGSETCSHVRVTKIEHEHIKNVTRCNRCMRLLLCD